MSSSLSFPSLLDLSNLVDRNNLISCHCTPEKKDLFPGGEATSRIVVHYTLFWGSEDVIGAQIKGQSSLCMLRLPVFFVKISDIPTERQALKTYTAKLGFTGSAGQTLNDNDDRFTWHSREVREVLDKNFIRVSCDIQIPPGNDYQFSVFFNVPTAASERITKNVCRFKPIPGQINKFSFVHEIMNPFGDESYSRRDNLQNIECLASSYLSCPHGKVFRNGEERELILEDVLDEK